MAERLDGIALGSIAAGAVLTYAGIRGKSIPSLIQGFVQGTSPAAAAKANQITGTSASGLVSATGTAPAGAAGSTISADALQYKGAGYVWGGAPAQGVGNWDCSSFTNWVCGHDEGLAIPGYSAGTYTGASHGPVTGEWLAWTGLTTVGHDGKVAQAGDIAVWQTHMGICLGPDSMISAQTPSSGTQISSINGFIPEILFIRRYKPFVPGPGRGLTVG